MEGTTHVGTHVDAPFHVDPDGDSIDALPIDAFVGSALLVDLARGSTGSGRGCEPLGSGELARAQGEWGSRAGADEPPPPRLLLWTGCDWSAGFPARWRGLSPDAARWCADRGLRLVGTDAPSVDPPDAEGLPAHRTLARAGIAIVECLALAGIEAGRYEFLALPLRWSGADASPVRAVLRRAGS